MIKKLTPNLIVDDVNKTVDFYQSTLGCFELIITDPKKGQFDWAMMRCEDIEIMLQSKNSIRGKVPKFASEKTGGNVVIYIEVDEIEPFYDWVKDRVKIITELHDTPYRMKEFLIEDCNGFIIAFAEWR